VLAALDAGLVAVAVDPQAVLARSLSPDVLVDAIIAKRNTGTKIDDAPRVIGVGPGFTAGCDCHFVVETMRGHSLGRVITAADSPPYALPDTGVPGDIGGFTTERLLRSPGAGVFEPLAAIGDGIRRGAVAAWCGGLPLIAQIDGIVRGLLPAGFMVSAAGMKCGDIDPRCCRAHCFTVSDKALAIAGGVLESIGRQPAQAGSTSLRLVKEWL
jgi:xanthine dehydrogenase accessory factor